MTVPKLRFPEFGGDWTQKNLNSILKVNSGKDYKHLDSGDIPVYGTGGYMTSVNEYLSNEDAIGIGRKGSIDKPQKLSAPFWTVDTLFYCTIINSTNLNFLYTLFNKINWKSYDESTGVPSLSKKTIDSISVSVPSVAEQEVIGDFFRTIDEKIQLQQEKIDLLKEQKKGFMQKIFSQELRFKGFNEDWKECKLGNLVEIVTGKLDANAMDENGKYDFYTSGIKKYKINIPAFEGPAITIAGNGATVGYMHYADGLFNAYQRTYVLSKFAVNRDFLFHYIGFKLPKKIQQEARTGNIPYIVMDMLTELRIKLPSDSEQEKIGQVFKKLDKLIKLNEEKISLLQEQKKGFMQQMFI